jgi:hypothetical protein
MASESLSSGLQGMTKAGLKFAIEEHKTMNMLVDIEAPIFIFPEKYGLYITTIFSCKLNSRQSFRRFVICHSGRFGPFEYSK